MTVWGRGPNFGGKKSPLRKGVTLLHPGKFTWNPPKKVWFRWYSFPIGWFFWWFLSRSFSGVLSSTNTHQLGICMTQLEGLIFFPYFFLEKAIPPLLKRKKDQTRSAVAKWLANKIVREHSAFCVFFVFTICLKKCIQQHPCYQRPLFTVIYWRNGQGQWNRFQRWRRLALYLHGWFGRCGTLEFLREIEPWIFIFFWFLRKWCQWWLW